MTDISSVLMDPDLGSVSFTVRRPKYTVRQGVTTETHTDSPADGCIHPGTPEMMQLLPEEERHREFIAVYTSFPLSLGSNPGGVSFTGPDRILYRGAWWRLVRLRDWSAFGYRQAYAVRCDV